MRALGADPDLHRPAVAVYDADTNRVLAVRCPTIGKGLRGREAALEACVRISDHMAFADLDVAVVEGQEIVYTAKSGANPRDIMFLATVAGAMAGAAARYAPKVLLPTPQMWKKGVPKRIHQARILSRLGFEDVKQTKTHTYPLSLPYEIDGAENLRSADWKHVVDAIGLAMWGAKS